VPEAPSRNNRCPGLCHRRPAGAEPQARPRGRAGIDSQEALKGKAFAALHRLQKLPRIVRGFYRDPNLRYITTE
jgi:hypothetical protein